MREWVCERRMQGGGEGGEREGGLRRVPAREGAGYRAAIKAQLV
jgi:hypothetical protein